SPGISMSRKTRSGRRRSICVTASRPSCASPTIATSGYAFSNRVSRDRADSSSSTMRHLIDHLALSRTAASESSHTYHRPRPVLIGNGEAPGNVGEADTRRSPLVRLAHADAVVLDLQANRIVLRACRDPQVAGAWLRPESVLQGVLDDRLQDE